MAKLLRYWSCTTDESHRHEQKYQAVNCENPNEAAKKLQGDYFKIGDKFIRFSDWGFLSNDRDPANAVVIWVIAGTRVEDIYSRPSEEYSYARVMYLLASSNGETREESGKELSFETTPKNLRISIINQHKPVVGIPFNVADWSSELKERLSRAVEVIRKKAEEFNPHLS